jgi:hypothetical protein
MRLRGRSASDLTEEKRNGNRNQVGPEELGLPVSSKIICKKNAVNVKER